MYDPAILTLPLLAQGRQLHASRTAFALALGLSVIVSALAAPASHAGGKGGITGDKSFAGVNSAPAVSRAGGKGGINGEIRGGVGQEASEGQRTGSIGGESGVDPAASLLPFEAQSIDLDGLRGIAYYSEQPDGFRIVATLAAGETGRPVRFEATLADRQSLTISVPREAGETSQVVEFSRFGDTVVVNRNRATPLCRRGRKCPQDS